MKIGISKKKEWEIVEVKELGTNAGEARPYTRQIALLQSDKEKVSTLFHEMLHCASFDYELGLTENQVRGIEKWFKKVNDRQDLVTIFAAFQEDT